MVKEKEQKKKFSDGLFEEFWIKSFLALFLMALIVLISSVARLIIGEVGFYASIALVCFYVMCYIVVHKASR